MNQQHGRQPHGLLPELCPNHRFLGRSVIPLIEEEVQGAQDRRLGLLRGGMTCTLMRANANDNYGVWTTFTGDESRSNWIPVGAESAIYAEIGVG